MKMYCGQEAEFTTPSGRKTKLYVVDAFDDKWVRSAISRLTSLRDRILTQPHRSNRSGHPPAWTSLGVTFVFLKFSPLVLIVLI